MNTNDSQWTSSAKVFQNKSGWKGEVPNNVTSLSLVGADVKKVAPGVSTVDRSNVKGGWAPHSKEDYNKLSTEVTGLRKSGELARHNQAKIAEQEAGKPKPEPIKIRSNK